MEHVDPVVVSVARRWGEAVAEGRRNEWWALMHPDLKLVAVQSVLLDRYEHADSAGRAELDALAVRLAAGHWEGEAEARVVMPIVVDVIEAAIPDWWLVDWNLASGRRVSPEGHEIVSFMRPEQHSTGQVEQETIVSIWPVLVTDDDQLLVRGSGSYWAPIPGWPPRTDEPVDVVDQ